MHNQTTTTDIINQALTGNRNAMARLLESNRRTAYLTAYRALANSDDAQDVAQEALIYALYRLHDLRDRAKFPSWLRHITLSLCADYRRRRGTRRIGEPIDMLGEIAEETSYVDRLTVRTAIADLSEAHRTTLLLHYEGGWSLDEVATLLEVPLNTVRSRLMAAKRHLRTKLDLPVIAKERLMITKTDKLTNWEAKLITSALPGSRVLSVQRDPEPWMAFSPRVRVATATGEEIAVDIRRDIDPARAKLLPILSRLGVAGPRLLAGPQLIDGEFGSVCEVPAGENLLLWTLGGTPHRINLATAAAFDAIDCLQGITPELMADPIGATLPRRTLADELAILTDDYLWNSDPWLAEEGKERRQWLADPWFADAIRRVRTAIEEIHDDLVYTHYLHFMPGSVRIKPATGALRDEEPLGWPGDPRFAQTPIVEHVYPFGHFGDPLLGLAMIWVYDCYPFVHTGFVEQYLWRRNVGKREFGPRLALKALQMIARDQPSTRPTHEGATYWDGLKAYVEQGLSWI